MSFLQRLSHSYSLTISFPQRLSNNVFLSRNVFLPTTFSERLLTTSFSEQLSHNAFLTTYFSQRLSHKVYLITSISKRLSQKVILTTLSSHCFIKYSSSKRSPHNIAIHEQALSMLYVQAAIISTIFHQSNSTSPGLIPSIDYVISNICGRST